MIYELRTQQPKLKISEKISNGNGFAVLPVDSTFTVFLDTLFNNEEYEVTLNLKNGLSLIQKVSEYEYIVKVDALGRHTIGLTVFSNKKIASNFANKALSAVNNIVLKSNSLLIIGERKGLIKSSSDEILSSSNVVRSSGII